MAAILTSEKCTVPLKECMVAGIFIELVIVLLKKRIAGTIFFYKINITAEGITQTGRLKILPSKKISYPSKDE